MNKIEQMYQQWSDGQEDSAELTAAYNNLSEKLSDLIGFYAFNEINCTIMECVVLERIAAFKGGFQQATEIWKECR